MGPSPYFPLVVVSVAAVVAAVVDAWKFKVHNLLTLPLLAAGLVYHGITDGTSGLLGSLGGALFGFSILLVFYLMGGMGGGDVKLMAAIGAWLGMPLTFGVFIASSLAAGIYATGLVLARGSARETWTNLRIIWYRLVVLSRHLGGEDRVETEVRRVDRRARVIPFATMIAVGLLTLIVLAWVGQTFAGTPGETP